MIARLRSLLSPPSLSPAAGDTTPGERWWRAAAWIATSIMISLHVATAAGTATAPRTPWDENGVLQMARLISGDASVAPMGGGGYFPGWSFLIAPIWWFTDDAETVYRLANVVAVSVGVATAVPLAILGRRLGLSASRAVVVAAIAMSLPSRTVLADYVLSEQLFTFFVAWSAVAAVQLWRRPSVSTAVLFGLAGALAYLTHARGLTVILVGLIWMACFLRRSWRHALVGAAVLILGYVIANGIAGSIHERILLTGFGQTEKFGVALSSTSPTLIAKVFLSQTWAQLVASFGLVSVGLTVLLIRTWKDLRRINVGPSGYLLGLAVAFVLVSTAWWAGDTFLLSARPRFDVWMYTRYIDPATLLVVVVALVALVRGIPLTRLVGAAAICFAVVVPVLVFVAPGAPTWGAYRGPGNAGGVLHWRHTWPTGEPFATPLYASFTNENRFWLLASVCVLLSILVMCALRRSAGWVAAFALITLALSSLIANPSQHRDPPRALERGYELLEGYGYSGPVVVDLSCPEAGEVNRVMVLNWTGYWLSPREVVVSSTGVDDLPAEAVISCDGWSEGSAAGARAVKGAINYDYRLWVLPGDLRDRLDAEGLLGDGIPDD